MLDDLPARPWLRERLIVNLDTSNNPGTHWVAIRKDGNVAYYFDSFGKLKPPKEIESYLDGVRLMYNRKRYQNFGTVICGQL